MAPVLMVSLVSGCFQRVKTLQPLTLPEGAPECYRFDPLTERISSYVKQNVDVWSFGCVLSEAAIWVVRGWAGLLEYRSRRARAIGEIVDFDGGDCFHNGETVLPIVRTMLQNLSNDRRNSDYITADAALYKLIMEMLEEGPARPAASTLYHRSQRIITAATRGLEASAGGRPYSEDLHSGGSHSIPLHIRAQPPLQEPPGHTPHSPHQSTSSWKYTTSPNGMKHDQNWELSPSLNSSRLLQQPSGRKNQLNRVTRDNENGFTHEANGYDDTPAGGEQSSSFTPGSTYPGSDRLNTQYQEGTYQACTPTSAVTSLTNSTHDARYSNHDQQVNRQNSRHVPTIDPQGMNSQINTEVTTQIEYIGEQSRQQARPNNGRSPSGSIPPPILPRTNLVPGSNKTKSIPMLSLEEVRIWKRNKKKFNVSATELTNGYVLKTLQGHDHVSHLLESLESY